MKALQALRGFQYKGRVLLEMRGQFPRECPLCGYSGNFTAQGRPPRYDVKCPKCGSFERHRLLALAIGEGTLVKSEDRVLHFAPEPSVKELLETTGGQYESADLRPDFGDLTLDIENLDLPDESYDVVMASHILEHVNDRSALAELYRILRPGGRLIVFVPIIESWATSYENPTVASKSDRLLHFGQEDHVRYYGRDLRERIGAAGFHLSEYVGTPEQCARYSLIRGERAFICQKP